MNQGFKMNHINIIRKTSIELENTKAELEFVKEWLECKGIHYSIIEKAKARKQKRIFDDLQDDISTLQNKIVEIPSTVYTTKDELLKGAFTDLDNTLTKVRKALGA